MELGRDCALRYDSAAAKPLSADELAEQHGVVLPDSPTALAQLIDTALNKLTGADLGGENENDVAAIIEITERSRRRFDAVSAQLYREGSDRGVCTAAGYLSMHLYLSLGLRLGKGESRRRAALAARLTSGTTLTGEKLEPQMPSTATAIADGDIGAPHALIIAETLKKIPDALGATVKSDAEAQLAELARTLNPKDLGIVATRLLAHLDPDGSFTDTSDRQRQRDLWLFPQDDRLMSKFMGHLTPAARAKWELIAHSWAAPGVNNPDDPESVHGADSTTADDASLTAARERDERNPEQRRHDAFEAMCDFVIARQGLGKPGRLSTELVISVSDEDLARRAGIALTSTGTLLPVADLVELAAKSNTTSYLAVFRQHTQEPLYLGRAKKHRLASKGQRLMLFARDGGCTAPGCDAPFIRTEAHHSPDWQNGGPTDINHLGAACGPNNRWVGPARGQWETTILTDGTDAGRMVWRPAGRTGPWQLNPLHHHERLAHPPAHAPPDERSRIEKLLEARMGYAFVAA
ncbi:hypothetical protein GOHSU_25_00540 [Gordonia hirsuta DSM 44140 = NBRC 16056]|uniref:HNH nuclease domain-containing protein n=1 Tax=Gordonia hirsuta DSM 44140 = NBRC 16056 TaxID=1121927 RepID=L7LA64_9ACTN|nr:HNH endonuclease signature motif containing protein [Gordonia hirsuta]GAC57819.1 hypothetical protein GOHSU_25_00540 [Gordonia hirsuta DSM 44140 = NBRC 16056]